MSAARVSIIIPTHNRASLLPSAIESARRAGGEPEIVVVDDASTDATPQLTRNLRDVRVVRLERNSGLSAARNAGVHASSGEFVAFLDDDDQRLPDSLPAQVEALQSQPGAAFCYAQVLIGDCATGQPTGEIWPQELPTGDIFWRLLRGNFIPGLSVVAQRDALIAAGLFDAKLRQVEDWDLWLRMTERSPVTAIAVPVATYRMFGRQSGQLSSNRAGMALTEAAVQMRALRRPRAREGEQSARECRRAFLDQKRFQLLIDTAEALLAGAKEPARRNLLALARIMPAIAFQSAEFRELSRLAFFPPNERSLDKRTKAVRKKLWAMRVPT